MKMPDAGRGARVAVAFVLLTACNMSTGTPDAPRADPAAHLTFVGAPSTATAGSSIQVTAHVTDAAGFPVANQLVVFTVTSGGGRVVADSATTDGVGDAKDVWTLGRTTGGQTLQARVVDPRTGGRLTDWSLTVVAQ